MFEGTYVNGCVSGCVSRCIMSDEHHTPSMLYAPTICESTHNCSTDTTLFGDFQGFHPAI